MRISDWSSDVCSSDLLRLAVEILLVAHPLEDLERGFLRHRARFALRHPQLLGIESYLGIARLEVLHDGLQRRTGELRITLRGVARRVGTRRALGHALTHRGAGGRRPRHSHQAATRDPGMATGFHALD